MSALNGSVRRVNRLLQVAQKQQLTAKERGMNPSATISQNNGDVATTLRIKGFTDFSSVETMCQTAERCSVVNKSEGNERLSLDFTGKGMLELITAYGEASELAEDEADDAKKIAAENANDK